MFPLALFCIKVPAEERCALELLAVKPKKDLESPRTKLSIKFGKPKFQLIIAFQQPFQILLNQTCGLCLHSAATRSTVPDRV